MMKKLHRYSLFLLVILLVLAACDDDKNQSSEKKADVVSVQLKWLHNPQFAGFYAADRLGYYNAEGIRVSFLPGGPAVDVVTPVETGTAQFGVAAGDRIIQDIAAGKPFQIIGATYQTNPFVYLKMMGEDNAPIEDADDWRGLRVMPVDDTIILAGLLNAYGLTLADIEIAEANFDLASFVSGESADVRGAFRTSDLLALEAQGHEVQVFRPEDYDVLTYPDVIFLNTEKVSEDLAERFMRATLKGWQYVVANPDKVADLVLHYSPSAEAEDVQRNWEASLPLIADGGELLRIDENVLESMVNLMVQAGLLTEAPEIKTLYTSQYLK